MKSDFSLRRKIVGFATLVLASLVLFPPSARLSADHPQVGADKRPTTVAPPKKSVQPARTSRRSPMRTDSVDNATAVELAFWNSIKDSTNSDDYRAYLKKYPDGQFAEIAQNRINSLEAAKRRNETQPATSTTTRTANVPRAGAIVRNQVGMELVYVPAGSFMMGLPSSESGRSNDERPQHQVTIREGFYMGLYEVTQAQWQAVMGSNPSYFKNCDQCPVEQVSWDDAQEFIRKPNARNDGYVYRLPTKSEWEYACRAGTTGDYAGNLDAMAWYNANSNKSTHAVGSKQPNSFGLYDMHGNVWEWCENWYHDSYNGAPADGSAWLSGGEQKYRVLRGGSWIISADLLRSAYRSYNTPVTRYYYIGFRVVAPARS